MSDFLEGFKLVRDKLPTIDYVYPSFTQDGLSEAFRFSAGLRRELASGKGQVLETLRGRRVVYTLDESVLMRVDPLAPRLRLGDQISGRVNTIYVYAPFLLVGENDGDFVVYVVKPLVDGYMAWFVLTQEEKDAVIKMLRDRVLTETEKSPVMGFWRRWLGSLFTTNTTNS